jgi:hypothetical protein
MDETFAWEILAEADPYPESIDVLQTWEKEFEIVIATTQPPSGRAPTFYWLGKHRVPCDEIHVTAAVRRNSCDCGKAASIRGGIIR